MKVNNDKDKNGAALTMETDALKLLEKLRPVLTRPLKRRQIVKALGIGDAEYRAFSDQLEALVESGYLVVDKHKRYALAEQQGYVRGRVTAHPGGYAFLVPPTKEEEWPEDFFLPPGALAGAMHGDLVLARPRQRRPKSSPPRTGPASPAFRGCCRRCWMFFLKNARPPAPATIRLPRSPTKS